MHVALTSTEHNARAAADKDGVAFLVEGPSKVVRDAWVVPFKQLEQRLHEEVGVVVYVDEPVGVSKLKHVGLDRPFEDGLHLETEPGVPVHTLVVGDGPVLALSLRALGQCEGSDAMRNGGHFWEAS